MFECVIFDWDQTLADSIQIVVSSFQRVLKENRIEINDDYIEKLLGIGTRNTFKKVFQVKKISFNEEMLDNFVKEKIKLNEKWIGNVTLFDGTIELLDFLKDRVKLGLATSNNTKVINKALSKKKIKQYFDVIITADDVINPKPDPEIFLKCAMKLKTQPKKCIVVEDSIFGVRAAKKANMKCIAIPSGAYSKEELEKEKPYLIVNSISEVKNVYKKMRDKFQT